MGGRKAQAVRYDWTFDPSALRALVDERYNGSVNGFATAKGLAAATVQGWLNNGTQPTCDLLAQALDGEGIPMEDMMRRTGA
jgi:hypothetical protein